MMESKNTVRSGLFAQKGEAAPAAARTFDKQAAILSAAEPVSPSVTDGEGAGLASLIRRRKFNSVAQTKNTPLASADNRPATIPADSDPAVDFIPNTAPVQKSYEPLPRLGTGGKRYQLTVRLKLDDYERFKQVSLKSNRTNQEVLEEAVREYLDIHVPKSVVSEISGNKQKTSKAKGIADLITRTFS